MLKMTILASIWHAQHPNAGQNLQQLETETKKVILKSVFYFACVALITHLIGPHTTTIFLPPSKRIPYPHLLPPISWFLVISSGFF